MKKVYYYTKSYDKDSNSCLDRDDLIFCAIGFSSIAEKSFREISLLALEKKKNGHYTIFEMDNILTEFKLNDLIKKIESLSFESFSAVRVRDIGLFFYLYEKKIKNLDIHLILDAANLNFLSLKTYANMGKPLARLVLSPLLSYEKLLLYAKELSSIIDLEILSFGPIRLLVTPRKLFLDVDNNDEGDDNDKNKDCDRHFFIGQLDSLESEHENFLTIENESGTFVFYPLVFSILDFLRENSGLFDAGIKFFRIDKRFSYFEMKKTFTGFFFEENTDAGLSYLKNKNLTKDEAFIGTVVDVIQGKTFALSIENPYAKISLGDKIALHFPEGKTKIVDVLKMTDFLGREKASAKFSDIVLLKHVSGVVPKTFVKRFKGM